MNETRRVTFAADCGRLDRAAHLRDSAADLLGRADAALLPFWQEKVLIDLAGEGPRLGWVRPARHLAETAEAPTFLGFSDGAPCFAADVSALDEETARTRFGQVLGGGEKFIDLRSICGELTPAGAAVAATAKALLGWHRTHRFCSRCGAASGVENGGWRRRCPSCQGLHFPRTDPVVIMLILRGEAVLIGRQSTFPPGIYSLLAGFVEPGETIEDAVRREVMEETRIRVGGVGYIGCQPWPFPASLMLGCIGEAETSEITRDPVELEDARWVELGEMRTILRGEHPEIRPPRPDAIARAILTDWVNGAIPAL
jgi:NAD+ diphosphatase